MNIPTMLPEHIDCPADFDAYAKRAGIKHVQGIWMQFAGHHRQRQTMRSDWLPEWQKWLGRELKFEAERSKAKLGPKDIPAWPAWQPPAEWELERAPTEQAIAALEAMAQGLVWLTCGHTAKPEAERGQMPACPHGCTNLRATATTPQPRPPVTTSAFDDADDVPTHDWDRP